MNTFDAIRQRRAIKHFDPNHKITDSEFNQLMDLGAQAPSSFNLQHWRIVNVQDTALRQQLRDAANNQAQVTEASLAFPRFNRHVLLSIMNRRNLNEENPLHS